MSDNVIEVQNLTKRYGQTTVVKGISFSVRPGEIFGLLGPNGSGKTTTILMLLGLTEISEGYVRLLGRDPAREPLAVKRRVGYLPDSVGFYDNLSAAGNLRYTARLNGFTPAEREIRIKTALAAGRTCGRCRQTRSDLFARYATTARCGRDFDERCADRFPR
jgi:ABC-2 type transport system ATP-binding protein